MGRMRRFGARGGLCSAVALVLVTLSGCDYLPSHLHDSGRLKVAEEGKVELAEYGKGAPGMYEAMLTNVERFKTEEDWLLNELAKNADTAFHTQLATLTGAKLAGARGNLADLIAALRQDIEDKASQDAKRKDEFKNSLDKAKGAVDASNKLANDAKKAITEWNAQTAFFTALIQELPKLKKSLNEDDTSVTDLIGKLKDSADLEVSFLDADGKSQKRKITKFFKTVSTEGKKESKSGKNPLSELVAKMKRTEKAPGLALELATLGLQLAQNRQKLAEAERARLQQRANLLQDSWTVAKLASALLKEANKAKKKMPDTSSALEFIALRRAKAPDPWSKKIASTDSTKRQEEEDQSKLSTTLWRRQVNSVHQKLLGLRYHAVAKSMVTRQRAVQMLELARIEHRHSIARSKIADEAWQSLIVSGLDGLVAYEKTGLKGEHLANILRLVQAGALYAISE